MQKKQVFIILCEAFLIKKCQRWVSDVKKDFNILLQAKIDAEEVYLKDEELVNDITNDMSGLD